MNPRPAPLGFNWSIQHSILQPWCILLSARLPSVRLVTHPSLIPSPLSPATCSSRRLYSRELHLVHSDSRCHTPSLCLLNLWPCSGDATALFLHLPLKSAESSLSKSLNSTAPPITFY